MEIYTNNYIFAEDMNTNKKDIFTKAYQNKDDINVILGLLDGIICRTDDILNGFLKQFKNSLNDENLQLCLEHTCINNNPRHIKTIISFLKNKNYINIAYQYLKNINIEASKYLEPYLETIDKENNIINNINIKIDNLSLNIYNINSENKNILDSNYSLDNINRNLNKLL